MKKYKAIFFDWDGTAVVSRKAAVEDIVVPMKALLAQGVKLAIISGTTIENIANGKLEGYFTQKELENLYLGLGRGAFNYKYEEGKIVVFKDRLPNKKELLLIHQVCFDMHIFLLENYKFETDIVFSRPNYCKIDLMVKNDRAEQLFFHEDELYEVNECLRKKGYNKGLTGLIKKAKEIGEQYGLDIVATTDAKYLEVGISSKSDNVDNLLEYFEEQYNIVASECSFWGDEYISLGEGLFGSDSYMLTDRSEEGDFFDVSNAKGSRLDKVVEIGGGVVSFKNFLLSQICEDK